MRAARFAATLIGLLVAFLVVASASSIADTGAPLVPIVVHATKCQIDESVDWNNNNNTVSAGRIESSRVDPPEVVPFTASANGSGFFDLSFSLAPGSYELFIVLHLRDAASADSIAKTLFSNFIVTVLANHPRNLPAVVCHSITLYDSHRTVAGILPAPGLQADLVAAGGLEPVATDGGAYYATSGKLGLLRLRVYLDTTRQNFCDMLIPASDRDDSLAGYQSLRLDVSWSTLADARQASNCRLHS